MKLLKQRREQNKLSQLGKHYKGQLERPSEDKNFYLTYQWVIATFPSEDWGVTMQSHDGYHCHGITILPVKGNNSFGIRLYTKEARSLWGDQVEELPLGIDTPVEDLVNLIIKFTRIQIK